METLNFRLAEEKTFHSEVLLFTFNPEHDIIVICSANGDVSIRVDHRSSFCQLFVHLF
jgi:hypothetical protein